MLTVGLSWSCWTPEQQNFFQISFYRCVLTCLRGSSMNSSVLDTSTKCCRTYLWADLSRSLQECVSAKPRIPRQLEGSSWPRRNLQQASLTPFSCRRLAAGSSVFTHQTDNQNPGSLALVKIYCTIQSFWLFWSMSRLGVNICLWSRSLSQEDRRVGQKVLNVFSMTTCDSRCNFQFKKKKSFHCILYCVQLCMG